MFATTNPLYCLLPTSQLTQRTYCLQHHTECRVLTRRQGKGRSAAVKGTIAAAILAAVLAGTPARVAAQTSSNPDWDAGVSHFTQKQYRLAISDFQKVSE